MMGSTPGRCSALFIEGVFYEDQRCDSPRLSLDSPPFPPYCILVYSILLYFTPFYSISLYFSLFFSVPLRLCSFFTPHLHNFDLFPSRRVEGWEKGALGRPIVAWAKKQKREREEQEKTDAAAAARGQHDDGGNGRRKKNKRRRVPTAVSQATSVAAAAAAGAGETTVARLRADTAAASGGIEGDISKTTFDELTIRLGEEYLYLHQLDCEHSLVFTRVRIASAEDRARLTSASFPRLTRRHEEQRRFCGGCDCQAATIAVLGDRLAPSHPAFYCGDCAHALHTAPFRTMDGRETFNRLYDGYTIRPYFFDCGNFSDAKEGLDGALVRTGSGHGLLGDGGRVI